MKPIISYCWVLVLVLLVQTGCRKPQALHYIDFQNFGVTDISKGRSDLKAELKFFNPNPYKMRLKSAEMDFYVNDQYFGRSTLNTAMTIPKADTFLIPVYMKGVEIKKVVLNGLGALLTNEYNIRLDGTARIGKAGIYFNFPLHYEGKQKLNLFK